MERMRYERAVGDYVAAALSPGQEGKKGRLQTHGEPLPGINTDKTPSTRSA